MKKTLANVKSEDLLIRGLLLCLAIALFGMIFDACTIAPKAIVPTTPTPGASGQLNSGVLGPQTHNGVEGWRVDYTLPGAYAILAEKYGARLDIPPQPTDKAFLALGDGTFWCSELTLFQYGVMHFLHLQDATLQSP
jgi:hypothetical protein